MAGSASQGLGDRNQIYKRLKSWMGMQWLANMTMGKVGALVGMKDLVA
jgi:hypothetical protein